MSEVKNISENNVDDSYTRVRLRYIDGSVYDRYYEDNNYGSDDELITNKIYEFNDSTSYTKEGQRIYINFNTNDFVGCDELFLRLYCHYHTGNKLDVYKITSNWDESSISYNNRPSTSTRIYSQDPKSGWNEFNISNIFDDEDFYGIAIQTRRPQDGEYYETKKGVAKFYSNEYSDTSLTPKIEISYNNYYLINDNGKIKTHNGSWVNLGTTPTVDMFKNNGMNNISIRKNVGISKEMTDEGSLGEGKRFSQAIDFTKFEDIESIEVV